jgi:thiol:disulfide interchange protein DsbC
MNKLYCIVLMLLTLGMTGATQAAEAPTQAELDALVKRVGQRMPSLVDAVAVPSPAPGIIELRYEGGVVYASQDGRFLFGGPLFDVEQRRNLTADYEREMRAQLLGQMAESAMIVFEPRGKARFTLTTFTDIDCGYCRKLHQEMSALNGQGIRVRYMMYPRAGVGSDAHRKAVAVWCSTDQRDAMTRAKAGEDPGTADCATPIEAHMDLARKLGLRGTPFSILESGEIINGYLPPERMLRRLAKAGAN